MSIRTFRLLTYTFAGLLSWWTPPYPAGDGAEVMDLTDDIVGRIEAVIRENLAGAVDQVRVIEAFDHAQNPILEVTVVVDRRSALDPQTTAGLVRHIRCRLSNTRADAPFPILSFLSKADAAGLKPEAA